jgi:RNA polymerase sigma-70 factor, ECF subfamily
MEETDIATAIQAGDELAFEQAFRQYYERLCGYANSLLHDLDEAEEAVQSVFLKLWERREGLDIQTSLKSYLYRAVHNRCLNRAKHEKVKREYEGYNAEQLRQNPAQASDLAIQNELQGRIEVAVASLPEQCRAVFKLSRHEGLKNQEIADQLGISVKTVENQMTKALKVLRTHLADYVTVYLLWILLGLLYLNPTPRKAATEWNKGLYFAKKSLKY